MRLLLVDQGPLLVQGLLVDRFGAAVAGDAAVTQSLANWTGEHYIVELVGVALEFIAKSGDALTWSRKQIFYTAARLRLKTLAMLAAMMSSSVCSSCMSLSSC